MKRENKDAFPNRKDRILVVLSLLGLLLFSAPLFSVKVYDWIFRDSNYGSGQIIGEVVSSNNDIRHKSANSFVWQKAQTEQKIRVGDSVFTGKKSQMQVQLNSGGRVDLDQNSLVVFLQINDQEVPNLTMGNFKLSVTGKMKVAIGGVVTELEGSGSEVQVVIKNKQKPQIRILKGVARVKDQSGDSKNLTPDLAEFNVLAKSLPKLFNEVLNHTDELYDFFDVQEYKIVPRAERLKVVELPIYISWPNKSPTIKVYGELSSRRDFAKMTDSFESSSKTSMFTFKKATLGTNFYRLSVDGQFWTDPQELNVQTSPLPHSPPKILVNSNRFALPPGGMSDLRVSFEGHNELLNFIVEIAEDPKFPAAEAKAVWSSAQGFNVTLSEIKTIFIRTRGVNEKFQVTGLSEVTRIDVEREVLPPPPEPPRLAQQEPEKIETLPEPILEKIEPPMRAPSSIATSTLDIKTQMPSYINRTYPNSKLSFEGAAFSMYSQEQVAQGKQNPTALLMGVRYLQWFGKSGVEASFKAKLMSLTSSSGGDSSPTQAELRYHFRWRLPFSLFNRGRDSQVSWLLGYEYYRNPEGQQIFSPSYDLVKTGPTFSFPVANRWDTGGELLYGLGFDSSKKYEVSGFLNYYVESNWSFGVGYRLHLFEAGSVSSSPAGLPFREGFGEGYSVLRWHY